jgi:hypothetical protein
MNCIRTLVFLLLVSLFSQSTKADLVNIRSNTLLLIGGNAFDLGAEFDVGRGFLMGPVILGYKNQGTENPPLKNEGGGFGLRFAYYLNAKAFAEGWIFALTLYSTSNNFTQGNYSTTLKAGASTLTAGYQWIYENGFNMTLAGGIISANGPQTVELKDASGSVITSNLRGNSQGFYPEFSVGWIF